MSSKPQTGRVARPRETLADVLLAIKAGGLPCAVAIRRLRRSESLTQTEFGSKLGMSKRQIWELEAGRANPTLDTLQSIGRHFGLVVGFIRAEIVEQEAER